MQNLDKVYQQVLEYLIEQIKNGTIIKGAKIPTERELSELLGVSRAAIREALKILDIIGLVEKVPSQGTYLKEELDNWLIEPMAIIFKLSGTSQKEVYEFRKMIEVEIATLAADRITDEEIEELTQCYNNMIVAEDEIFKAKYDKKFHYIIAKATKNYIIFNAYNAMSPMLDLFTVDSRSLVIKSEGEDIMEEMHKNIYISILNRDKKAARDAMNIHMNMISKYFK